MTKILMITGPAGAGKTTTCREFLKNADGPWAYISQDDTRQLIKAGYASADGYERDWSKETKLQWEVSIPICTDLARRYNEYGINCIIDFNASVEEFEVWKKFLDNLEYQIIILLPSEEVVLSRNRSRNEISKLKDNKILQNYELISGWRNSTATIIDTSNNHVSDSIRSINQLISAEL